MEKIKLYGNKKREKGAITLFVLLACLFFVFILTGVYLSNLNKLQVQEQEVQQIYENYARDIDRAEEIYNNLVKTAVVTLRQEPSNGTWTKEVTLIGNAKLDENSTATIQEYMFYKENESQTGWITVTGNNVKELVDIKKEGITTNGTYYFLIKDSEGEIHKSNEVIVQNIDNNAPTAGTLIAKEQNEDETETEYELEKSPWTDKDVKIEKVDGTDGEGETETVYTILKDGVEYDGSVTNPRTEPTTLTETGEYTVTVITTDKVGNTAEREYTIKIDKVVPILALKHNDANGVEYEQATWTKDNLYGEISLDTSKTGKEVEKYQYSENGVIWKDISSEIIPISIDYTTTFPMSSDKPDWITGPINNGTYYFEVQADGTLKPTNGGNTGSTNSNTSSDSYFEIDLTNYPEASLDVILNTTISSENNYDFGYAELTESTDAIAFNKNNEYDIKVSGTTTTNENTITIEGGKKYYLHIGYYKDSSNSSNQDTFIINSISLKSEQLGKEMNFANYQKDGNKVTFTLNEDIEKEIYVRAVYTDSKTSKYGEKTSIKIDKKAPIIESAEGILYSREDAKIQVKVTEKGSGLKGYYISTDQTAPTENSSWTGQTLNEFTIENLSANTTYYLWVIDNVGNISERKDIVIGTANYIVDDKITTETISEAITAASDGSTIKLLGDYTDTSTATFNKSVTFDVQSYTLTRQATITINNNKTAEITGTGKITSGTSSIHTITNSGTLTISNNITIENTSSSYAPIYTNNSNSITNINDNVQIIGYYRGIYNYYGTLNVNGGKIEATNQSSSVYGIYNYSRSTVKTYINNGEIKGYNGIYNGSSSTLEMTGGKVVGTGAYGVAGYGTTNIYGGRIEGKTYGLYSTSTNKVTIGREEDELSTTNPAIYGASYGIYMNNETYSFNFYNGVIISNTKETSYRGELNPRTGHMSYTYFDYDNEQKYCTILIPTVENITMEATPTEYTNGDVTVTITYPYVKGTRQYSEDGTTWKDTEEYIQEVIVTENKTIYARTTDESGIITDENQIEITNIDKEKPTVTITPNQTVYTVIETNGTVDLNITLTAQDTGVSGLDKMQYAWVREGQQVTSYTDFNNTVTINKAKLGIGQYNLYINVTDKAGNKADLVQMRYTVRYEEPVCQIGSTKYTRIQEAVEACSKEAVKTEYNLNYETKFPMSSDKPEWINGPVNNGTYYFNEQTDRTLKPNNSGINNTIANSYFEIDLTNYLNIDLQITLDTTISSESNADFGYATITTNTIAPTYNSTEGQFIYVSGTTNATNSTTIIKGGQKYYLHIGYRKSILTNSYNDTFIINNIKIKGKMPEKIIEAPTTIEMLKSTDEEFSTYEGQNIILDLKGYTVGSSNIETPLCINNGTLQLIDSSTEKTGKLESLNGTTILNNGTFTLGDNSTEIEYEAPTIYGYKIGIENNNVFNFYDGKIQGITPIKGNTTDTPEEYGPVSTGYENGITTIQLGIVTGYEARIEWVYYTTVQEAVNATRINIDSTDRDTVTIIKDIQLKNILEIEMSKDLILDLNGCTLTIKKECDTIIYNYGNLEIMDSDVEKKGTIYLNFQEGGSYENKKYTYLILNKNEGNLIIKSGKFIIEGTDYNSWHYNSIITNESIGNITIYDGNIENNSNSYKNFGIYNLNTGNIEVKGGMIKGGGIYGSAIYNLDIGNIIIEDGLIDGLYCGIDNESTGSIILKNGTINAKSLGSSDAIGINNKDFGYLEITGGKITTISGERSNSCGDSVGIKNESGTINVTGGRIYSTNQSSDHAHMVCVGISNSKGNINIENIQIEVASDGRYTNSVGISNSSGNIIIHNIDIKAFSEHYDEDSNSYGIYNSTGTININDGTVSSNGKYCQGIHNEIGTITIGDNNKNISLESPFISGISSEKNNKGEGIYNVNGNINFYNGTIQGNIPLVGNLTKIRDNCDIEEKVMDGKETIYLVEGINEDYIVQIEKTKYYSLTEAINSLKENEQKTIEVLRNFEIREEIKFNKDIILDLRGYTITNKYYKIENISNLKIIDSTNESKGKIETINTEIGILNSENGNIIIEGGTINNNSNSSNGSNYGIYNSGSGKVKITGGNINSSSTSNMSSYGMYNYGNGIIEVIGGTVNSSNNYNESYGIYNYENGIVRVIGGNVNSSCSNSTSYGISNEKLGKIEIIGGTVSSNSSRYSSYGIYNNGTGSIEITGGIICSINSSSDFYCYGIRNQSNGIVKMSGGNIISTNNSSSISDRSVAVGIYNYNKGAVEVIEGTVISTSNNNSYGIYNNSVGNIIIGTKDDGLISTIEPLIQGVKTSTLNSNIVGYGIYNVTGKLYFYDGKIEGTTKAVYEIITEKEENSEFNYNEDETVLTLSTEQLPMAQIGNVVYYDLQEAINSVTKENNIIKILRNVTYTIEKPVITIPNEKDIVLDLNGYKIASAIPEKIIQNEGKLQITDTSKNKTGLLTTSEESTIYNANGAELIINEGTIENKSKYAINNQGNLIVQGSTLSSSQYGIYNTSTGAIEMTGGTVSSSKYGIYNVSSGIIDITGGTINSGNYGIYNSSSGSIRFEEGQLIGSQCGIYNSSTGKVEVTGGMISSSQYGIYNASTGVIEMTGGTVSSNNSYNNCYGIYNKITGSIIIGTNEDGLIVQKDLLIEAIQTSNSNNNMVGYGVYNPNGILYYYDGKIQGTDKTIYGNINEIEDSTKLVMSTETEDIYTYKTVVLEQEISNDVIMNNIEYDSVSKAIKESGINQNTIKLLKNTELRADIIIEENQNIIIDLNGYTLSNYNEITNNGILKIIDTSTGQTGEIISAINEITILNKRKLELNAGTITDNAYGIKNTGTLNITGGKIENTTYGIYNDSNGNVTITNGKITSNTYGIYNYTSTAITNISGGTISSNEYGIYNYNGTINITSSGITSNTYGIYNAGGTTNIKENTQVQSNIGIYVAGGTVNIGEQVTMNPDSPIIIGETYGLSVAPTGVVYMYDGQIKGKSGATQGFITYTENGYVIANKVEGGYFVDYLALAGTISTVAEVNGVSYSNLQSAINSIVGNEPQTIKLLNGIISDITFNISEGQNIILDMNEKTISSDLSVTINNAGNLTIIDSTGSGVGKITSTTGTAIVNSGTLRLGQDDGTVSQDLITIEGNTYGIENTGTLNFYDGTINGASAVKGTVTNRATGYVIRITTVNGKERYYLST